MDTNNKCNNPKNKLKQSKGVKLNYFLKILIFELLIGKDDKKYCSPSSLLEILMYCSPTESSENLVTKKNDNFNVFLPDFNMTLFKKLAEIICKENLCFRKLALSFLTLIHFLLIKFL